MSIYMTEVVGRKQICLGGAGEMCIRDRVMTGSNDNSSLGLYKAVEKTDENGNNYFEIGRAHV